jgi:flagellar basal-body rod protein FlgB
MMSSNDITLKLMSLALDAALMRQTAIANNIAHSNNQGYQSMTVNFEQQLAAADQLDQESLSRIKPALQNRDQPVAIDQEIALSIENITHYRALIKGLNQKLSIMKLALQGNNAS